MADRYEEEDIFLNLGFLERSEPWILSSRFFRSKMGGKPAWLDLQNIPEKNQTFCKQCDEPLSFLCQLYCPLDENKDCFHRTIFIFICKRPQCKSFVALRCQLPRKNKFYPFEPPVENPVWHPEITADSRVTLCRACGLLSGSEGGKCGKCKKVHYCQRKHQEVDWKLRHKKECTDPTCDPEPDDPDSLKQGLLNGLLFPEYEIKIAADDSSDVSDVSDDENDDGEEANEEAFKDIENEGRTGDFSAEELAKFAAESAKEDKALKMFKKVTDSAPDQVVRYGRDTDPIWICKTGIPDVNSDVPDCEICGEKRVFEFQIMPQMLNSLKLDVAINQESVDWGVLAIYTCKKSCNAAGSPAYKNEFVWRQMLE